jgi:hypothetical protein
MIENKRIRVSKITSISPKSARLFANMKPEFSVKVSALGMYDFSLFDSYDHKGEFIIHIFKVYTYFRLLMVDCRPAFNNLLGNDALPLIPSVVSQ